MKLLDSSKKSVLLFLSGRVLKVFGKLLEKGLKPNLKK